MKPLKWHEEVAREYNRSADANLRFYATGATRWANRIAAAARQPTSALLAFAYVQPPFRQEIVAGLATVRSYTPRGIGGPAFPPGRGAAPRKELPQLQNTIREMIAGLILRPSLNDAENPSATWTLPTRFEATVWCVRSSPYGLGPELKQVKPPWMADALRACSVLLDAIPWLRFCDLCGRLFFKVKQQRVCSLRCRQVLQSRERWTRLRKTEGVPAVIERLATEGTIRLTTRPRGRPRTPYREPFDEAHTTWLRMLGERRLTRADRRVRHTRRQG